MTDNPLPAPEVTTAIRTRILNGDFVPGQRLVEADLCGMLDTGRRQVREALAALTHEGLVEQIANKGARVRTVEPQEALHLAEARFVLERACLERTADRITKDDIAALRGIAADMQRCVEDADPAGFARASDRLFQFYVELADQPVMRDLLERLQARNVRHRNRVGLLPGWLKTSWPMRQDLVEALCKGDAGRAVAALTRHHEAWKAASQQLSG